MYVRVFVRVCLCVCVFVCVCVCLCVCVFVGAAYSRRDNQSPFSSVSCRGTQEVFVDDIVGFFVRRTHSIVVGLAIELR